MNADLIVMSSRGHSGVRKMFFGSTTERVLRDTTVPVLVTPDDQNRTTSLSEIARHINRVMAPVDLSAGPNAPLASHPTRVQVRVTLAQPREDGMRDAAELEPLGQLEDALVEWLEQTYDAIYVGHLITDGALHVVAYAPADRIGDPGNLLEDFDPGDYEVGWLVEDDPDWGMLLEFLYPDAYAMQVIQNRRLMSAWRAFVRMRTWLRVHNATSVASAKSVCRVWVWVWQDDESFEPSQLGRGGVHGRAAPASHHQ